MVKLIEASIEHKYNLKFKADNSSLGNSVNINIEGIPYFGLILAVPNGDLIDLDGPSRDVILALEYVKESIRQILDGKVFFGQYFGGRETVDIEVETVRGEQTQMVDSYIVFYGQDSILIPQISLYGSAEDLVYLTELASTMYKVGDIHQRQIRMAEQAMTPEQIAELEKQIKS